MIPFLFRTENNKFVVQKTKFFSYKHYDSSWMCDPMLGDECLVLDVDIAEEVFEFDTERDALKKMQELWAEVKLT